MVDKVIVMMRLDNGESATASVCSKDKPLSEKDKLKLLKGVAKLKNEDALYYTIRATIGGIKFNWKMKDLSEVYKDVEEIWESYV